jgi:hypothetical protein
MPLSKTVFLALAWGERALPVANHIGPDRVPIGPSPVRIGPLGTEPSRQPHAETLVWHGFPRGLGSHGRSIADR